MSFEDGRYVGYLFTSNFTAILIYNQCLSLQILIFPQYPACTCVILACTITQVCCVLVLIVVWEYSWRMRPNIMLSVLNARLVIDTHSF